MMTGESDIERRLGLLEAECSRFAAECHRMQHRFDVLEGLVQQLRRQLLAGHEGDAHSPEDVKN